jgi:hypothetical protein
VTFHSTTSGARQRRALFFRRGTFLALLLVAVAAGAQDGIRVVTSTTPDATRAELTHRLDSLQRVDSTSGKPQQRRERRDEIAALRTRLTEGDFQTADRFLIDFGAPNQRPDTVTVRDSSNIALLNWPSYSLHGVLRSELQAAMEKYVGTYLREPRLRVYPLTRLTFTGGVGRPGAYPIDPAHTLSDAIMSAGGTGQFGKSNKISVYRGKDRIMDHKQVAAAIRDGSTIEELGLRSGDEVRVPVQKQAGASRLQVQTVLLAVSVVTALIAFIRASYVP